MNAPAQSPSPPGGSAASGRVWTLVRILNVRLRFIFLMIIVGLLASHWGDLMNRYDRWRRPVQLATGGAAADIEYYCPMHPNIIRSEPGSCPICGMPLSKREKTEQAALPPGVLARVQLTPAKVALGGIATSPIGYQLLSREIRTVGTVSYDETSRALIAARIRGRIDQLMVNFVGQRVAKGDPLASLYSPDLLVAQQELLQATAGLKQATATSAPAAAAQSLVEAARRKLLLWGITEAQLDEIIARGTPQTHLTIYSPISGIVTEKNVLEGAYVNEGDVLYTIANLERVWMLAEVFEDQIAGIAVGQAVEVNSAAYPNEVFAGRIAFVAYTVDPIKRTTAARVEVTNPDYKLRPGMYVTAFIRLPVGEVTEAEPASRPAAATDTQEAPLARDTAALVRPYLDLMSAFVQDKTNAAAANDLAQQAKALVDQVREGVRAPAAALATAAEKLEGKDLKAQRVMAIELNARLIEVLRAYPPADLKLFVAHCPMVNADWLQTSEPIRNPYYGSEMLTCGSITGPLAASAVQENERYALGYFCPIYPGRLFDKPQHCPVDGFPLKYMKVEKVLAIPQAAVIDTGTRKIAYRESEPGVFEMVEVKLGQRAGEYFPILAGLEAGERVATVGAFLVDAENRLNPGAAATYFGASGRPQSSSGSR